MGAADTRRRGLGLTWAARSQGSDAQDGINPLIVWFRKEIHLNDDRISTGSAKVLLFEVFGLVRGVLDFTS